MINETDTDRDSRQRQPSSSSRQLTKECPASHKENLKVKGLVETPEQKTGTLYHAGFEGDPLALHQLAGNADFKKLNNYFKFQERKIIRQIFRSSSVAISREKRVWLYDADGERIFSGRRDLKVAGIVNGEKIAFVLEYKTGWKPQPPADQNLQIRANAALAQYEEANETGAPYARIYGGVLERPGIGQKFFLHALKAPELEQELDDIENESAEAMGTNPRYNIGSHCEKRSAIGICPEIAQKLKASEKLAKELSLNDKKALKNQNLNAVDTGKLKDFLKEGRLVATSYENARKLAHSLLTINAKAFGGAEDIYLKAGNEVRVVDDLNAAYDTLKNLAQKRGHPIDKDDLMRAFFNVAKLTISDLNEVIGQVLEIQEEKDIEGLIGSSFKRSVRIRQNEPSLKVTI
jgi:hypothetical protein